jgi:hypothetical protein
MFVAGPMPAVLICPNPALGTPCAFLCGVAAALVETGAGISARLNMLAKVQNEFLVGIEAVAVQIMSEQRRSRDAVGVTDRRTSVRSQQCGFCRRRIRRK